MNLANEGLEARKKDEEVAQRKRKAEDDKNWEGISVSHFFFSPYSLIAFQIIENNVLIAGAASLAPARRRRRQKL